MKDRDFAGRFEALQTLTVHLARALNSTGVLSDAERDRVLNLVEHLMSDDSDRSFAAHQLAVAVRAPAPNALEDEADAQQMEAIDRARREAGEPTD